MKRCPNCGRLELLLAHTSCDGSAARISLYPNPYRPSRTVLRSGHTPPHGQAPFFELPARLPMLLGAAFSLWRRGFLALFAALLLPLAVLLGALTLPVLVDSRAAGQLGVGALLFLPLWIAAEAAGVVWLAGALPGEGRRALMLRAWSAALRQVPRLAFLHAQLLLLMAAGALPGVTLVWLWPDAVVPAVLLGLLGAAWPWARFSLALPLVLLEGHPIGLALRRSAAATAAHRGQVWRLSVALWLLLVGGVFLAGRGLVVSFNALGIDGMARGLSLLALVVLLPPALYGPLVTARLVLLAALPRVRFASAPAVLATVDRRADAEALVARLAAAGISADIVGGADPLALHLLVTDARIVVADVDLKAAEAALASASRR